jgi:hypothetical protein
LVQSADTYCASLGPGQCHYNSEKKKKNVAYVEVKHGMMDVVWKQQMLEGQEVMEEMMEEQVDVMRELVEIFRKWLERMVGLEEEEEEEDEQMEGTDKGKGKEKETDRVEEDGEGGDAGPLSSA